MGSKRLILCEGCGEEGKKRGNADADDLSALFHARTSHVVASFSAGHPTAP
jgi:hypothetical protein